MVVLTKKNTNLNYRKIVLKKIIQGMLNIFYILSEKKNFGGRGVDHPS